MLTVNIGSLWPRIPAAFGQPDDRHFCGHVRQHRIGSKFQVSALQSTPKQLARTSVV